jgi:Asp-tRNA(Asn)/Glu-tRNA(Gln) amidotransferase A subunit family amidase
MTALHDLSADTLSSAYRAGQLSPVEVTRAALAHINAWKVRSTRCTSSDEALAAPARLSVSWLPRSSATNSPAT